MTKTGRTHAIVVPQSTALTLSVRSNRYTLTDSSGHAIAGDTALQFAAGTKPAPIHVAVSAGHP